jgi:hypothetical protein
MSTYILYSRSYVYLEKPEQLTISNRGSIRECRFVLVRTTCIRQLHAWTPEGKLQWHTDVVTRLRIILINKVIYFCGILVWNQVIRTLVWFVALRAFRITWGSCVTYLTLRLCLSFVYSCRTENFYLKLSWFFLNSHIKCFSVCFYFSRLF